MKYSKAWDNIKNSITVVLVNASFTFNLEVKGPMQY